MSKKKPEYAELTCPVCEENADLISQLSAKVKQAEALFQDIQIKLTKAELTLEKAGLLETVQEITDVEAICVGQIKRLLEFSALRPLTETEAKILDTLHKNLRMCRGEKVDFESKKKMKAVDMQELLTLVKSE